MTSNVGSQEILTFQQEGLKDYEQMKAAVVSLLPYFRPEFLNRIDEIVVFHALGLSQMQEITGLLLSRLNKRLAEMAGFELNWTPEALTYLAEKGYDPSYGHGR